MVCSNSDVDLAEPGISTSSNFPDMLKVYDNFGTIMSPEFGRVGSFPIGTSIVALPFTLIGSFFHAADLEIAVATADIIATLSAVVYCSCLPGTLVQVS